MKRLIRGVEEQSLDGVASSAFRAISTGCKTESDQARSREGVFATVSEIRLGCTIPVTTSGSVNMVGKVGICMFPLFFEPPDKLSELRKIGRHGDEPRDVNGVRIVPL